MSCQWRDVAHLRSCCSGPASVGAAELFVKLRLMKLYVSRESLCRYVNGKKVKRKRLMVPVGSVLGNLTKAMAAKVDSDKGEDQDKHSMVALPCSPQYREDSRLGTSVCLHLEEEQRENR